MWSAVRHWFSEVVGQPAQDFAPDDHRVAAAALLVHLVTADGRFDARERARLHDVLKSGFALDDSTTDRLIEVGLERDRESVDFYGFTRVLLRTLDETERLKIVEMMWEVAFADGVSHEFEENIVWRAADLMGISARDRVTLRQRVAASRGTTGEP